MPSQLLSDVIEEYMQSSESRGDKPNTIKNKRRHLSHFLTSVGNIQTRNVTGRHVDGHFTRRQGQAQPQTLNNELSTLKHFFKWCAARRYIAALDDPVADRRNFKVAQRRRLQVPRGDFDRLLENTSGARDRIVVALGLYLFLRQSEIAMLTISDVDMEGRIMHVTVEKTGLVDDMPICDELAEELQRWFAYYEKDSGELQPAWYLCPARHGNKWIGVGYRKLAPVASDGQMLKPLKKMVNIEECAQRTLVACGYPIRNPETGKSNFEGIHTLRRSGARALYDELLEDGYDGALRTVQAMLHHATAAMTERYLGITLDEKRRNDRLRGRKMFRSLHVVPTEPTNVIPLTARKEA